MKTDQEEQYDPTENSLSDRLDRIDATLERIEEMLGDQTKLLKMLNPYIDQ